MDSRGGKRDAGAAFRRFEEVMRKLVRVPKKVLDGRLAESRKQSREADQAHQQHRRRRKPA